MKCNSRCLANIVLIILLIIASMIQLNSAYTQEMTDIKLRSIYISQSVNELMVSSIQQLDLLGNQIESTMSDHQHEFQYQIESDGDNYSIPGKQISLIGVDKGREISDEVKDEIANILAFGNALLEIKDNLSNIEWIYYLSSQNFIGIYPKTTQSADVIIPDAYNFEFFKIVSPELNPDKITRFTKVYEDKLGKGSMITISRPIYKGDLFKGALSIDYTLKGLSELLKFESNELVNYELINEYDQLIASSKSVIEGQYLDSNSYLTAEYGIDLSDITREKGVFFTNGDYYILILQLEDVPIDFYVVINRMTVYISLLSKIFPIIASLMGVIVILSLYFKTIKINDSLEKSERKFKYVFDQSTAFAVILDAKGHILYANQRALSMTGEKLETISEQYFPDSMWWAHSSELKLFIDEAIKEIIKGFFIKKDVILQDVLKKNHVYTLSMFGIRDDLGKLDYIATTGIEITDRIEMESKLEGLSKTDLLTQTYNRRGMYEILDQSVSLYKRKETPFVVLICDIDFFKNVNDTYGHMVGDEILSGLAILLKRSARPYDVVGRWGGEEFTILLQDTTEEEGLVVAERIRRAVSQHPFKSELTKHVIYISLTIGLKSYNPNYDIRQILKMADDALYHGKENGRNQVVNHSHISVENQNEDAEVNPNNF